MRQHGNAYTPEIAMSHRISKSALATGIMIVSFGLPARADEPLAIPPQPNPKEPVNYLQWLNDSFGADVSDKGYKAYLAAYKKIELFEGDWGERGKHGLQSRAKGCDEMRQHGKGRDGRYRTRTSRKILGRNSRFQPGAQQKAQQIQPIHT